MLSQRSVEIGISSIVVMPPAAAALVPETKSSRSTRPGSRVWTCVSMMPGQDVQAVGRDGRGRSGVRSGIEQRVDPPVTHGNRGGIRALNRDDVTAFDDEVVGCRYRVRYGAQDRLVEA